MKTIGKTVPRVALGALLASTAMTWFAAAAMAQGAYDSSLTFDPESYQTLTVTVDGVATTVRRYETVYVGNPIEMAATQPPRGLGPNGGVPSDTRTPLADPYGYQKMYIFVPESAVGNDDAAIVMRVGNGGWFASGPQELVQNNGAYVSNSNTDATGTALAAGYVVVSTGTRSRGAEAVDGQLVGKAPAAVVDAKAAIRYLRLNDTGIPGSAERVVISGTSGGGALSAAVAASGNSAEYYPYLAEIGAAGIGADGTSTLDDDVFATIAYVPVTDLGNADKAYEWQYEGIRTAANTVGNDHTPAAEAVSAELAAAYPAYLESLGLTLEDGTPLTADTMDDALLAQIRRETEDHIAEGGTVPAIGETFAITRGGTTINVQNDWLTVENGAVAEIDLDKFLNFVTGITALKVAPAFDATANTDRPYLRGENSLFGTSGQVYSNFTEYGWNNNQVLGDGSGPDDTGMMWAEFIASEQSVIDDQLRLIDPFAFLNTDADTAPFWYLRHGMIDRDTAFAVNLALYHAVSNDPSVQDVNFELAWLTGHAGNYDVQEAYSWLAESLASVDIAPVPVPASLPLALGGLGILGAMKRRKQRQQ